MTANTYDQLPYPSLSYGQSHPDRLATVATLLGMNPAPVERCRVLELGCAGGGNILPMAYGLPGSTFIGIDYSARQVAEGQAAIQALGLKNVAIQHMNIMDVNDELGEFDYIIAHGVFSWVPRPVQDKMLELCRQNLAPHGVAYISYNTYPGWHMLGIIRDMMLYRTRNTADLREQVEQARDLLDFLADSLNDNNDAYASFINMYAKFLQGETKGANVRGDSFLLHDELEEVNEPCYFHQFIARAGRCGLQYLGEAQFRTMMDSNFSAPISEKLNQISQSVIDLEQYMDFVRNRTFRQTLLCRQEVPLSRTLKAEQLMKFYAASQARPVSPEPDIATVSVEKFRGYDEAVLSTDHPVTKAAMLCLRETWPGVISFRDLLYAARARLDGNSLNEIATDAQVLGVNLLKAYGYSGSLMELHVSSPAMMLHVNERPVAGPVARWQAQNGDKVTNLRHERVTVDELDQYLLPYLDGSRDLSALVDMVARGPVAEGVLHIKGSADHQAEEAEQAEELTPDQIHQALEEGIQERLGWLARAALLVG